MSKMTLLIENLIADLHSSDWEKRCEAARLLGQSGDERAVDALLPHLQDHDWRVRRNAVQALGALKSARALEPLLEALNDRANTVRQRAAVALGRIKDPSAIPVLIRVILESENYHVVEAAYHALRKFGKKAAPCVLEALQEQPNIYLVELLGESKIEGNFELLAELAGNKDLQIRQKAVEALGKSRDPRAVGFLMQVMYGEDSATVFLSVQALGHLNAMQAIPHMLDLLKKTSLNGSHSALYHAVTEAFQEMSGLNEDIEAAFPGKFPSMMQMGLSGASLPESIGQLESDHFRKLNDMLANMERRMEEMGKMLGLPEDSVEQFSQRTWQFGSLFVDARDAREERVKVLIQMLAFGSPLKRAAAALTLPWYTDSQSVGPLEEAVHDADPTVAKAARWALAALTESLNPSGQAPE